jgi:tRNA (adenine22-N1)-methyltransferase
VAELLPAGCSVADVGAGDGLLAAWLATHGHRVIATENKAGPLAVVRGLLDPLGVECRLGEGLEPIRPGEVEAAVIAGVGGGTIARILAASPEVVAGLRALVLQPVQQAEELFARLAAEGYREVARAEIGQGSHRYTAVHFLPPYSIAG